MRQLPQYISFVVKTMVSIRRIENFLLEDPLDTERIRHIAPNEGKSAVKVTDSTFSWQSTNNENAFKLESLNLDIPKKQFVAIIGDVGSGKSSILYSLLGEMAHQKTKNSELVIAGSLALAGENPWILNKTLRDNILFGKEFDQSRYEAVIKCTCLDQDIHILPKGDQTEIGERGINLSGGQKARVSLARACYQDADIYLLDDPLSALDSQVSKKVLEDCFLGYLRDKTRILITHKLECLPLTDFIYIMKDGKIVHEGPYSALKECEALLQLQQKIRPKEKPEEVIEETPENLDEVFEQIKEEEKDSDDEDSDQSQEKEKRNDEKSILKKTKEQDLDLIIKESSQGDVTLQTLKLLAQHLGGRKSIFFLFASASIFSLSSTLVSICHSSWSEAKPEGNQNYIYFATYLVLGIFSGLTNLLKILTIMYSTISSSHALHDRMFQSILRAPITTFLDRIPIGRILNRLTGDLTIVDEGLFGSMNGMISELFLLFGDFITAFLLGAPWMFPLTLFFLYLSWRVQRKFLVVKREVIKLEQITRAPIISLFGECLNGLTVIRAFKREDDFMKLVFMDKSRLSEGTIGGLTSSLPFIDLFMFGLLNSESEFESKIISLERCFQFTELPSEREPKHNSATVPSNWPEQGAITLDNYSVKYRENLPKVLKSLSIKIRGNEKVGIVGRTGSGKSTIMLSLLRILEAHKGVIEIDGIDISKMGLYNLRQKITIIPQDPMLVSGTLRDNIDLLGRYTDQEIWDSLEKSCLKKKFEGENGLKFIVKEGGSNLSAGEKQLICICRAILAKNKIILIDEATSNIDIKTEEIILETIHKQFADCTVLTVAHRLKTVIHSDKILVLDKGKVVEFDSPANLLNREKSYFKRLWNYYTRHSKHP